MRDLDVVVRSLIAEHPDQIGAIVGPLDAGELVADWRELVRERLGADIVGCSYDYVSVGITVELLLDDDRRCVLKVCRGGVDGLDRALRVPAHLATVGFPAPAVLMEPRPSGRAQVFVLEALDRGEPTVYDERVMVVMAREYARLNGLIAEMSPRPDVIDRRPSGDRLWPTPHSAIFDFEGTQHTAAAIDGLARRARQRLRAVEAVPIVAHGDWSMQNMAFRAGRIVSVFDWDSISIASEVEAVATAAAFHQQDWRLGPTGAAHDFHPGPEIALAFADEYARVSDRPWTRTEQQLLRAALVQALAYQARCEHAFAPTEVGPAQRRLMRFADAFGLS